MLQIFYNQGNSPRTAKLGTAVSVLLTPIFRDPVSVPANVLVEFIDPPTTAERLLLLGAVISHADDDYRRAVIDGHTAADTAVTNAMHTRTAEGIPAENPVAFMIRVRIAEAMRREHGLPDLPERFRSGLKTLNAARNRVAHPRPDEQMIGEQDAAEALTTATFAVNWAEAEFGLPRP